MISKSHSSQQNIPQTSKCAPTRAYFVYGGFILEDTEVFHSYPNIIVCAEFHLATDNRQNGDGETRRERHFSPRRMGSPLPALQWQSPTGFLRFRSLAYHSLPPRESFGGTDGEIRILLSWQKMLSAGESNVTATRNAEHHTLTLGAQSSSSVVFPYSSNYFSHFYWTNN